MRHNVVTTVGATEHLSKQFDAELEAIRSRVLEMGGLVESQIRRALDGFNSGDRATLDDVIATDHRVNAMEVALDGDCSQVIVKRQPAANDLRLIIAIIKTVTDLERIGDEAQKIARMAKSIHERGGVQAPPVVEVRHAAERAISMLRRTLDAFNLEHFGHAVLRASSAEEAEAAIRVALPDVLVLDWMLPGESGLSLARRLRADARTRDLPILMLTARAMEQDKISGLEAGADDYLTKPFSPKELAARIKAVLRRRAPQLSDDAVEMEGLRLDPATRRVTAGERRLALSPSEFRRLLFLMTPPRRISTRGKPLRHAGGDKAFIKEPTVDVHIRRLRKALEPF